MALPSADQSLLRRYLLGTVTPESREDLEARLFSDDRIFSERLTIAEDELVGDYVQSALTDAERQDFEKYFLCTDERRAKLEFARALHAYAERSGSFARSDAVKRSDTVRESRWAWLRRPVLSPAWAVAAAALLVLVVQVPRFASSSGDAVTGSNVVAISLTSGRTRASGGELTRIRLNADSQVVRLQLDPEPRLGARGEELPAPEQTPEVISAIARRTEAEQAVARSRQLAARNLLPAQDLERAETQLQTAKAAYDAALASARNLLAEVSARSAALKGASRELQSTRFATYRASLFQVDDDALLAEMRLIPASNSGGSAITLTLPAESLAEGDYYVRLQGLSPGTDPVPLQRYDFRIVRH